MMKAKGLMMVAALVLWCMQGMAQESQKRFGFELSGGASMATRELNDAKLKPGAGFEGIFHYRILPHTGLYAGWGWNRFSAENSFAGTDMDFEETGYVYGIEFKHPLGESKTSYYLRAGGLYNHIEIENKSGEIVKDSGHGMGWQLAGGIDLPLGSNWSLTPGLKFNALSRDVEVEGVNRKLDLNYVSLRIGIQKRF